jgi:hypothetical protein
MDVLRTEQGPLWKVEVRAIGVGTVGGFVAGIAMGLLFQFGTDLMPVIGALGGEPTALRGWLVHLVVSALYGAAFAVIVAYPPVRDFMATFGPLEYVMVAIVYAVMMAAVTISLLPFVYELPWATPPGGTAEGGPGPSIGGLVPAAIFGLAHVVYGAVLGVAYVFMAGAPETPSPADDRA